MSGHLRKAFTLIELMVAVSIIVILASLAVPSFVKYREASYAAKCVTNLRAIQDARESYFLDNPGTTSISGSESAFLAYLGEVTTKDTSYVLVDSDALYCPYDYSATYALSASLGNIDTMPTCPNAAKSGCGGHVYSGR